MLRHEARRIVLASALRHKSGDISRCYDMIRDLCKLTLNDRRSICGNVPILKLERLRFYLKMKRLTLIVESGVYKRLQTTAKNDQSINGLSDQITYLVRLQAKCKEK